MATLTEITESDLQAWAARLSGAGSRSHASGRPPEWIRSSVMRMRGVEGMHQLSNMGVVDADDPAAFDAALLRYPVGDLMVFSTLQTPHVVTFEPHLRDNVDIVILGVVGLGGQRLVRSGGVEVLSVGRMGFMSTLASSSVDHVGLNETTGIVVPTALLSGQSVELERGVGLIPDTPLTRALGASFGRLLAELLHGGEMSPRRIAETESALVGASRILIDQCAGSESNGGHSESVRTTVAQLIETRHSDPDFGVEAIAAELHISRRQLYRHFVDSSASVAEMLLSRRIATAQAELIQMPPHDLEYVAQVSGFSDAAALRAVFRRRLGVSPSEFRRASTAQRARLAQAMLLTDEQSG
ncbi:helix-turn-helix domain-containing protein [Microbacterium koreense]|uniref:Helix-turn-helix domain-containing protein n=1 Tax=Microbacterium koreense TaxID=323761 RepID=A0ABW2ZNG8_9MICO